MCHISHEPHPSSAAALCCCAATRSRQRYCPLCAHAHACGDARSEALEQADLPRRFGAQSRAAALDRSNRPTSLRRRLPFVRQHAKKSRRSSRSTCCSAQPPLCPRPRLRLRHIRTLHYFSLEKLDVSVAKIERRNENAKHLRIFCASKRTPSPCDNRMQRIIGSQPSRFISLLTSRQIVQTGRFFQDQSNRDSKSLCKQLAQEIKESAINFIKFFGTFA